MADKQLYSDEGAIKWKDMGDGTVAEVMAVKIVDSAGTNISKVDANGNLLVNLGTQIAGEDQTNNVMVGAARTISQTTQGAVSLAASASNSSTGIAAGIYRKYRVSAAGSSGNVNVKLEWSPDNGVSGWYYVNDNGNSQYPLIAGDVIGPYVRVTVTNQSASTQTISAYLALST